MRVDDKNGERGGKGTNPHRGHFQTEEKNLNKT
jgi:hypothetical protein